MNKRELAQMLRDAADAIETAHRVYVAECDISHGVTEFHNQANGTVTRHPNGMHELRAVIVWGAAYTIKPEKPSESKCTCGRPLTGDGWCHRCSKWGHE